MLISPCECRYQPGNVSRFMGRSRGSSGGLSKFSFHSTWSSSLSSIINTIYGSLWTTCKSFKNQFCFFVSLLPFFGWLSKFPDAEYRNAIGNRESFKHDFTKLMYFILVVQIVVSKLICSLLLLVFVIPSTYIFLC